MRLRNIWRSLLALGAILGAATPVLAEQPTSQGYYQLQQQLYEQEQRLQQLEQFRLPPPTHDVSTTNSFLEARVAELEEMVQQLGKDKPASTSTTLKVSGRVHYDYWVFPDGDPLTNFLETGDANTAPGDFGGFRRLRFGVRGDIGDTMEYKIEMEFANPSALAFKDAYLGWNELPILRTVLLGNQKRPYGLDHLNSSRYNVFLERPYVIEANNQDARRIGVCSYGVSENERWNWRYGYFFMDDPQNQGAGLLYSDNYQSEFAARLANTIWYDESSGGRGYAHWAVSGTLAFPSGGPDGRFRTRPEARTSQRYIDTQAIAGLNRYQMLGLEGVVNVGPLSVVGEYQTVHCERTDGFGPDLDFQGGYVYVAYFLTGEHTPWERKSGTLGRTKPFENFFLVNKCTGGHGGGWGAWQIAARYSHGDYSDDNIFGGVGDSITVGLNWWWTPYSRVQFNYGFGSIDQRAMVGGAPLAAGLPTNGEYDFFGTRWMCDF